MISTPEPVQDFSKTERVVLWLGSHWVLAVGLLLGVYVLLPFLAPALMAAGLTSPAKAIYWIYSFLCHQLPERSYFLFGPKISYSLSEIQTVWRDTTHFAVLRQFTGNPQMGWKVAWSDRMVSMFTSLWAFGILWGIFRKNIKPLPWWGFILFLLPMAIDGTSHLVSDLAGPGQGYRDSNTWLAVLTQNTYPRAFYAGDAWGSFNAWMRLVSGLAFGLGTAWFCFPYLDEAFTHSAEMVTYRRRYRSLLENEKERLAHLAAASVSIPSGAKDSILHKPEGGNDLRR